MTGLDGGEDDPAPSVPARVRLGSALEVGSRQDPLHWLVALLVVVTALPLLVGIGRGFATTWAPANDRALEILRMSEVGSRQTPLVGAYSRLGWDHPGPLLFWFGAPFLRLFGPGGVLAAVGAINLAGLVGALAAARRLGGRLLLVAVAAVGAVMVHTLGVALLVDPWNPHVTYLPLLCFLLCAAGAAESTARWLLPAAVASGSFVAQSHLGAASMVGAGSIGAVLWWWSAREPGDAVPRPWRSGVLAVALWSGPLVDQLTASHNVTRLARYFLSGEGQRPSLSEALGVAARELGFRPAWTGGIEQNAFTGVAPAATWTLGLSGALLLAAWLTARRLGDRRATRLVAYVSWLSVAAIVAMSRTTDGLLAYVVRWSWVVAALGAASVCFVVGRVLQRSQSTPGASARGLLGSIAVAATLVAGAAATVSASRDDLRPNPAESDAIETMSTQVRARLAPGRYAMTWRDPVDLARVPQSLAIDLLRHDYDIVLPSASPELGDQYTGRAPTRPALVVLGGKYRLGWVRPAGSRLLVSYEPLAPAERRQAAQLARRIRADTGQEGPLPANVEFGRTILVDEGADPNEVEALGAFQLQGVPWEVWEVPPTAPN